MGGFVNHRGGICIPNELQMGSRPPSFVLITDLAFSVFINFISVIFNYIYRGFSVGFSAILGFWVLLYIPGLPSHSGHLVIQSGTLMINNQNSEHRSSQI